MALARARLAHHYMLRTVPGSAILIVCAALAPALFVWWSGRRLAAMADDPLLPERLLAQRLRGRSVLAAAWAVLIAGWWGQVLWPLVLMIAARAVAAYPLRRALNGETWSVSAYLLFFTRLVAAFFGFWLVLLGVPELVSATGRFEWLAAGALGLLLFAWNASYVDIVRRLLATRAVADAPLQRRFDELAAQAGIRPPRLEVIDVNGGVFANAVALPSLRRPAVVLTSTLLERLDFDEIVAICAHELAHIEQHSPERLRRLNRLAVAMIAAGVLIQPAANLIDGPASGWTFLLWMVAIASLLTFRARSRQKDETASDLRALALTGNAAALVSGLVRLHAIGRVPRRWESRFEQNATHPSLARRIQAIRAAAGEMPASLTEPVILSAPTGSLTFHADALQWSEGTVATHSLSYGNINELRLDVNRSREPRLIVVEPSGRKWEIPIPAHEAGRVQRTLDVVDERLAKAPSAPSLVAAAPRLVSAAAALVAVSASQFGVIVPIALAALRPTPATVGAAAAGVSTAAIIALRDALASDASQVLLWPALVLGACGCALLGTAWIMRKDEQRGRSGRPLAVLAGGTALVWLALLAGGGDVVRYHQAAKAWPSAIVLPVALAAGLAAAARPRLRAAAVPVALAGAFLFLLGSQTYVRSFSSDPFLSAGPELTVADVRGPVLVETPIEFEADEIRLSPAGRYVALSYEDDDERTIFRIGPASGPFVPVDADNAVFAAETRIVTVTYGRDGADVRLIALATDAAAGPQHFTGTVGPTVLWAVRVPSITWGRLSVDAAGTWQLVGRGRGDDVLFARGRIGEEGFEQRSYALGASDDAPAGSWADATGASGPFILVDRRRYSSGAIGGRFVALATLLAPPHMESHLTIFGPAGARPLGASSLWVDCEPPGRGDGRHGCLAFDGARTTLFAVDLAAAALAPVASMRGRFIRAYDDGSGWVSGWRNGQPLAARIDGTRAWQLPGDEHSHIRTLAANDRVVAAIVSGSSTRLRIYSAALTR